jgi:hypothetical protein
MVRASESIYLLSYRWYCLFLFFGGLSDILYFSCGVEWTSPHQLSGEYSYYYYYYLLHLEKAYLEKVSGSNVDWTPRSP